ncbi:sigma factor-like helix-turn-helix DNA-binding protein [Streptomyces sp. GXMU-J15]|uniref:Sigma factor-like helix-turn-helix DNA-binding protein n=1 Tax=Streptomyces fuscus TaxID=3048495 RepID=A0ABT7J3R4_9ACTN|nr:sigma factor-like helix-turn-helix DNA-binding protein [Streptomyces fuscus]MDL2079046.1 sigma factor-like helix-turn-helix DNA-binding protein [Streptomyces fuscus]
MPYHHKDFAPYAQQHWPRLVTTAHLLCGDAREATKLVRNTLVGVCARWRRMPRDDVDFYVRRSLVRAYLRGARRAHGPSPEGLGALSARQRVVLVLLHREGLREAEVAQMLGCSVRAVKSLARLGMLACEGGPARLRTLLATDVLPGAVPLDAIERRGRALRRRRAGAVVVACALVLGPSAALAANQFGGADSASGAGADADGAASSPVRIVTPGERVEAVRGVRLWLTDKGKHWSTPLRAHQFLGLAEDIAEGTADGTADGTVNDTADDKKPHVSAQFEPLGDNFFLSGLYHGLSTAPGRVEASLGGTEVTGTVLTLAGSPGWGVWYARAPLSSTALKASLGEGGPTVTVYDAAGKAVARSDVRR